MISVREADVRGKRVLVRVDFDTPLIKGSNGMEILNDQRMRSCMPTIEYLLSRRARLILVSKLGRPSGTVIPELSMRPIAAHLYELVRRTVYFTEGINDPASRAILEHLQPREIALLENIRFWPGEEANNPLFGKQLADLADLYVNDAFAVSHRAEASVDAVTHYLPAYAGFALVKEVETLSKLREAPEHPFVLIIGGVKISDKIAALDYLSRHVDRVLVGGAMASTLLRAKGEDVKKSLIDESALVEVEKILKRAGNVIVLPIDFVWHEDQIMDIGPKTIALFRSFLVKARMVFWNGSLGKNEESPYDTGTNEILKTLAHSDATTIVSGGDTGAAAAKLGVTENLSFVSMGGGATLDFLAGKQLPGLMALDKNQGGQGLTNPDRESYSERPLMR